MPKTAAKETTSKASRRATGIGRGSALGIGFGLGTGFLGGMGEARKSAGGEESPPGFETSFHNGYFQAGDSIGTGAQLPRFFLSFSSASSMPKLSAFWDGGNSLNEERNFATPAWAGTIRNARSISQS